MEKADALSLETETSSPNRVAFEAGLFAVAVAGAVDLGLGALALSPGFGVRAVVGGGVAHGSVFPLDWRTEGLLPLAGELRIALGLQRHEQSCGFYS